MKVFTYYRVSTELQEHGVESQRLACQRYAKENGLEIIEEFSEEESAFKERPIFELMLKRLKEVDGVLVFDLDRLTREPIQLAKLLNLFFEEEKRLFQVIGEITDREEDILLARIKTDIAAYESEKIRRRIKAGINRRREEGLPLGRPKKEISKRVFDRYVKDGKLIISKSVLCEIFNVSRVTLLNWLRKNNYEFLIEDSPFNEEGIINET